MPQLVSRMRAMEQRPGVGLVLGLGGAALALAVAGVLGALAVNDGGETDLATGSTDTTLPLNTGGDGDGAGDPSDTTLPLGTTDSSVAPGAAPGDQPAGGGAPAPGGGGGGGGGGSAVPGGGGGGGTAPAPSQPGQTRIGITASTIRWALHAPVTFDGAPLNLAEDPLEGVEIYIEALNAAGGINGRKIEYRVFDDRYTVSGGRAAAQAAVNDYKPFFVSGTLGVDQVYQVASEAKKRGVPYMAAGGPESVFEPLDMYQIAGSYDTYLSELAEFLAVESKRKGGYYEGRTKVGVFALDSPYISPSVKVFENALKRHGLEYVGAETVKKPTEQTTYQSEVSGMRAKGAQIVVPAQDPITTSRIVAECAATASAACPWRWSFANFAHESDVALSLMGGSWTGVRGLAGGCYYLPKDGMNPYDTSKCGAMKQAHEQWVQVRGGGKPGEDDWRKDGQGGAAGYQIVHIWTKALRDLGRDPTRERFVAALNAYEGYTNLVSAPISYAGGRSRAHGADAFVPYEALSDRTYKQLTPTFVSSY